MNDYHPRSRSIFWKSIGILILLLLVAVVFLYFYDTKNSKELPLKIEPKKAETKADNMAGLPKGQMEDGPALEDLPLLENMPATAKIEAPT